MYSEEQDKYDARRLELENRIKNLVWTVSGDYTFQPQIDTELFLKSKYIALYEAIKQGALAKYFDRESLALYILKKIYCSGEEKELMAIVQFCVEAAVYKKITAERSGIDAIRQKAYDDIVEYDFAELSRSFLGQVRLALLRQGKSSDSEIKHFVETIRSLETADDTQEIIRVVDYLYNIVDDTFQTRYGTLEKVLAVTVDELAERDWSDYWEDIDDLSECLEDISHNMTSLSANAESSKEEKTEKQNTSRLLIDEEAAKKMASYIELNYGRSYLSPEEQKKMQRILCRGNHRDCQLYFTEGILQNPVRENYQYVYAWKQAEDNKTAYCQNYNLVRKNIDLLTNTLRYSLLKRNEPEFVRSDRGNINPALLWRAGRVSDFKLFTQQLKVQNSDFVIDILIDASASQRVRQGKIALQAYIISEALSNVGLPYRVMSFCTFWDYVILHRFREYDDGREKNKNIFQYMTSANNRDGLAVRAAAFALAKRSEENKILIVLSDGKPHDIIVNRPGGKSSVPYTGEYGIRDTALEIRKLREQDIAVLGVFAGEEKDLQAERRIFGRDFVYIRNIANFSHVVGSYLKRQIDNN